MTICVLCRNDTTILRKDEKDAVYNFLNSSIPNEIPCNIDLSKPIICGMHRKKLIEDKDTVYTKENIVNVKNSKCKTVGCHTLPSFNFPGEKKRLYCSKCANKYNAAHPNEIDMKDVKNPRCKTVGCNKQPSCNFPGQKKRLYCTSCADKYNDAHPNEDDMEDVVSTKCKTPGCPKHPSCNFPGQNKRLYCRPCADKYNVEHPNEIDMENVANPKCKCGSLSPKFNFPGETKGLYCSKCADLTKMKNVVNKYCSSCGLIQIHPSTNTYGGLCVECAQHKGIAKRPRNIRVQEKAVAEYLKKHFKNITLSEDTPLEDSCVRTRPDISSDFGNFILIVEIDENQHKGKAYTSCDTKRNVQLLLNGGSRPIVFIRFNPDSFKKNGKIIQACFQKDNTGKLQLVNEDDWNSRLDKLRQEIVKIMIQNDSKDVKDLKEMTYVHLYFDE